MAQMPDLRQGNCPLCGHNVVVEVSRVNFGVSTSFVENPASIPIGEEFSTKLIEGSAKRDRGPYR